MIPGYDFHRHGKRKRLSTQISLETLDRRALPTVLPIVIDASIIQIEQNRVDTKYSIGNDLRDIQQTLLNFANDVATTRDAIYDAFFATQQQEVSDHENDDVQAVEQDIAAEQADRQDLQELNVFQRDGESVGQTIDRLLNGDASTVDHDSNTLEGDLRRDPSAQDQIVNLDDSGAAAIANTAQNQTDAATQSIENFDSQVINLQPGLPIGSSPPTTGAGIQLPATLNGLIGSLTYASTVQRGNSTLPLGTSFTIDASGNIKGQADVEKYAVVDANTGQFLLYLNSQSGQITGTYKPGNLASSGTFSFQFPGYTAEGQTVAPFTVTVSWTGTITSSGGTDSFTGNLYSGGQEIGTFTLGYNPH